MPLKLICGPAGSGKTTRAIDAFLAAVDRGENAIFIAPSRPDQHHFQRRILAARPVLSGGKIATFDDLLCEFIEDENELPRTLASAESLMLLRAIADGPGKPETLAASSSFDGFITELSGLINELEEAGVPPEHLGRSLKKWAGKDQWRRGFNQDIFRLFDEYQAIMEEQGAEDSAQSARRAVDRLAADHSLLGYQSIIVDGFQSFTPLQLELIDTLRDTDAELIVTLPFQEGKAALGTPARYYDRLKTNAETELLTESFDDERDPAIRYIAENLFEEDSPEIPAGPAVTLLQAAGVRGQAELVAAEVLRLWREENTSLDDVAVITRDFGQDSLALAATFADFGIPFEMYAKVPLMSTPVGRTAAAALELAIAIAGAGSATPGDRLSGRAGTAIAGNGGAGSLLAYLRSPLPVDESDRVDQFDRLSRTLNSDDPGIMMMEWNHHDGRPLVEIDRLVQAAALGITPLANELADIMRSQVRATAASASVEKLEMDATALRSLVKVCEEAARAGGTLSDLRSRTSAGDPVFPGSHELQLLRDCIDKGSWWPKAGSMRNCVRLLDPHRVLNQRFDAIFVCGLLEGQFPVLGRESALLNDADRDWLRQNADLPLDAGNHRLDDERYLFQRTLTRARNRIYLCYPYCDQNGEPTVRSLFVDDTLDLFEGGTADAAGEKSWETRARQIGDVAFAVADAPTESQALLSLAARNLGITPDAAQAAKTQIGPEAAACLQERLQQCRNAATPHRPKIGDEVKQQLAAQEYFRVTELERYLECPFKYFLEYVVRLQPLERDDFFMVRGSLVHSILYRFFNELKPGKICLPKADDGQIEQARRMMRRIATEEIASIGDDLRSRVTGLEIMGHLDRLIDRERIVRPGFVPYDFEMSFGICDKSRGGAKGRYDEETMLQFGDIKLCGKIDRIDLREGTNQAVVIDYKTSKDDNLPKRAKFIEEGTIQVPLYMLAAREIWGFEPIGGEYYGILGKRRRGLYLKKFVDILGLDSKEPTKREFVDDDDFESGIEAARKLAIDAATGIRSGDFPCIARNPKTCDYCDYDGICRQITLAGTETEKEHA